MDVIDPGNRAAWDPAYDMMKRPLWKFTKKRKPLQVPIGSFHHYGQRCHHDRILTMSMNLYVGGFAPATGRAGTGGGWAYTDPYRIFNKMAHIIQPSSIFLFLDMREDNVNWKQFPGGYDRLCRDRLRQSECIYLEW